LKVAEPDLEPTPLYAGRFVRRRGPHGDVDVLATATNDGWKPLANRHKLFPKSGQVELSGVSSSTLRPGDWLAFKVVKNGRSRTISYRVSTHHIMPRYLDLATLGSAEAARLFFTSKPRTSTRQVNQWAVRFASSFFVVLDLVGEDEGELRLTNSALERVPCYEFDAERILPEPGTVHPALLYDLADITPVSAYDWSRDGDYIARVVRSLSRVNDQSLKDIITWLELHRDEQTGLVSATGVDPQNAFEAIRSGELASRLKADTDVMAIYLSAVRDDPAIAAAVAEATKHSVDRQRESVAAILRDELEAEHQQAKKRQDTMLEERERSLKEKLDDRLRFHEAEQERAIQDRLGDARRSAEQEADVITSRLRAEIVALTRNRDSIIAEQNALQDDVSRIASEMTLLAERRKVADDELARVLSIKSSISIPLEAPVRRLGFMLDPTDRARGEHLSLERISNVIERSVLLTRKGKTLMEYFIILMLAGELPVLEGDSLDEFALIAEPLVASGRFISFDVDATVLTPEDIWARPGSALESLVAQACNRAKASDETFLVQLRGIERSAARSWYPALAAMTRRGIFGRRFMLFATVVNQDAEEWRAMSGAGDICRVKVADSVAHGAWLLAPSLLSGGQGSNSYELDPGLGVSDLSPALSFLPALGVEIDISISMRIARIIIEALSLRPSDRVGVLTVAQMFCRTVVKAH